MTRAPLCARISGSPLFLDLNLVCSNRLRAGFRSLGLDQTAIRDGVPEIIGIREYGIVDILKYCRTVCLDGDPEHRDCRPFDTVRVNKSLDDRFGIQVVSLEDRCKDLSAAGRKFLAANFEIIAGANIVDSELNMTVVTAMPSSPPIGPYGRKYSASSLPEP